MLNNLSQRLKIKMKKMKQGVYIAIHTEKLKKDVEFILFNLPKDLIKGIEIIEQIYEVEHFRHQIIVKQTMSAMDIKRQIGKFIFREKRWPKQEEIAKKVLAEERIDLDMFYDTYSTNDYMKVYEIINSDIFAVFYGNESMNIDEVAIAINSLYIKQLTDKHHTMEHNVDELIDSLFDE